MNLAGAWRATRPDHLERTDSTGLGRFLPAFLSGSYFYNTLRYRTERM